MTANLAIPGDVDLVRSFVNTIDADAGTDLLTTRSGLGTWLSGAGLVEPDTRATARDLQLALRLRGALRRVIEQQHASRPDGEALSALDEVCRDLPLRAVSSSGNLAPSADGVRGALGQIAAAVTTARIKGTWERLKICPADDCAWAFYDTSRNHSKRWCSMDVCGNRSKVRAFRHRAR